MAHVQTFFDGVDITSLVQEGSVTHTLNQPAYCTIMVDSDQLTNGPTTRCKLLLEGNIDFHGICMTIEDQGDEEQMSTTFTFADPTVLFAFRPARDSTGDFSKPSFMITNSTAPAMVQEMLIRSLDGSNPALGEGPMGIVLGTFAGGGVNLSGMPADWPKQIDEV